MSVVRPKKFLGQHFLKDLQVAQAIADTVDACPDIPLLEVGPGMGGADTIPDSQGKGAEGGGAGF